MSNRDARSVANLVTFKTPPPSNFFFSKKATSDKSIDFLDKLKRVSQSVSVIVGNGARSARTQLFLCICSVQRASERSSPVHLKEILLLL